MTGLIGGNFSIYSPIIDIMTSNQEQPILTGQKPAFLFPFGRRIGSQMNESPCNAGKTRIFIKPDEVFLTCNNPVSKIIFANPVRYQH